MYKIISFLALSILCAYGSSKLDSSFVDKFAENILGLLTTLFAINIASSTLIAGKLREIQDKTGHTFPMTKKSLKNSFYEQIFFIGLVLIFSILRESKIIQDYLSHDVTKIICDSVIFLSFIFYIDVIRDIGKSLFDLLDFGKE